MPLELAGHRDANARAAAALDAVGLSHRLTHLPSRLSGGEQQRVAIARAFAPEPSLLLADEPTGNLDHATGAMVMDLLFALRARHGSTLLLITHDAALAARCDRQIRLVDGKISQTEAGTDHVSPPPKAGWPSSEWGRGRSMTSARVPAAVGPLAPAGTGTVSFASGIATTSSFWQTLGLAFRFARRDLRGGVRGLTTVLLCLALGVGVIAAVGSLRAAVDAGLAADGRRILGGDVAVDAGNVALPDTLRQWLRDRGATISDVTMMRSLLVAPSGERTLIELKAVDAAWPLVGQGKCSAGLRRSRRD